MLRAIKNSRINRRARYLFCLNTRVGNVCRDQIQNIDEMLVVLIVVPNEMQPVVYRNASCVPGNAYDILFLLRLVQNLSGSLGTRKCAYSKPCPPDTGA
jgi:hypothetical protein